MRWVEVDVRPGEKGDNGEGIKSDAVSSSDWQEIIDKRVYLLFSCDCRGKAIIRTIMSEAHNPCAW